MEDARQFFEKKRPWSRYKDLILDYYLEPYLNKVKNMPAPVLVVDCFAGAGRFGDGSPGSPLIIGRRLDELSSRGKECRAVFIETDEELCGRLRETTVSLRCHTEVWAGDFREHIRKLTGLAASHTVFLYVDPIRPSHLRFDALASVYEALRSGRSVETLVNFLSTGFVRWAEGLCPRCLQDNSDVLDSHHKEVLACNEVAGGEYWQDIVYRSDLNQAEKIDLVAGGYCERLQQWFPWVLSCAIRRRYEDAQPKYHLIFGSRYFGAVDLMNRAMVRARRKFVGARFVDGMLFANQPSREIVDPGTASEHVMSVLREHGSMTWEMLRVHVTQAHPSWANDAEWNTAIKLAIRAGSIGGASGDKIEEKALLRCRVGR